MYYINRFMIAALLALFASGELNAMNQPVQAMAPRADNLRRAQNRVAAALCGASWGVALATLAGDQLRPAYKKSLCYAFLFSFLNSKANVCRALCGSACMGGVARLLGFNWQTPALFGVLAGVAPAIFQEGRDCLINTHKNRISQHDPAFVRIRREFAAHQANGTEYHDRVHKDGSTLGKPWWIELEAGIFKRRPEDAYYEYGLVEQDDSQIRETLRGRGTAEDGQAGEEGSTHRRMHKGKAS